MCMYVGGATGKWQVDGYASNARASAHVAVGHVAPAQQDSSQQLLRGGSMLHAAAALCVGDGLVLLPSACMGARVLENTYAAQSRWLAFGAYFAKIRISSCFHPRARARVCQCVGMVVCPRPRPRPRPRLPPHPPPPPPPLRTHISTHIVSSSSLVPLLLSTHHNICLPGLL